MYQKSLRFPLVFLFGLLLSFSLTSQASTPPAQATSSDTPKVDIQTNQGDIVVELFPAKAPKTVANFLKYVDDGFYTNTLFHRVIAGFMIQGGGFTTQFELKPTNAPIPNEADNGLKNLRGTIAMARTVDPQSATSQFFINVVDNPHLDFQNKTPRGWGYCVFGKVVKGMDVVDKIANLPTGPGGPFQRDVPKTPVVILSIKRITPAATTATTTSNEKNKGK